MMNPQRGRGGGGVCLAALRLAAADGGVPLEAVRRVGQARQCKSVIVFLAAGDNGREPTHVVKLDRGLVRWSPRREFEGMSFASTRVPPGRGFAAVTPVGFSGAPPLLVSRYVAGRPGHRLVRRALLPGSANAQGTAHACARSLGRWLAWFRGREPPRSCGATPAGLLACCAQAAEAALPRLGRRRSALGTVLARAPDFWRQVPMAERGLMRQAFPSHGDLRLHNVVLDGQGSIRVLDLEDFDWEPLDRDSARMRIALELSAAGLPVGRRRAEQIWRSFADAYVGAGGSAVLSLLSYLMVLPRWLEWAAFQASLRPRGPGGVLRCLRERRWIRGRQSWLAALEGNLSSACDTYVRRL